MTPTEQIKEIAEIIRQTAKEKGLTSGQVAYKSGCSKSYICQIFRGKKIPHIDKLGRIAAAVGVTAEIQIGLHNQP